MVTAAVEHSGTADRCGCAAARECNWARAELRLAADGAREEDGVLRYDRDRRAKRLRAGKARLRGGGEASGKRIAKCAECNKVQDVAKYNS
jgi:hypothetical protein